jgi:CRISPR-associated protein Cas2
MNVYLVCFDIADDRNRDRVGTELLAYGERVQKSVFEIVVRHPGELDTLRASLAPLLESGDDLRFYRLCADCRDASVGLRGGKLAVFPAAVIV